MANLSECFALIEAGRVCEAKQELLALTGDEKRLSGYLFALGLACFRSGDFVAASAAFRRYCNRELNDAAGYLNLGAALASSSDLAAAEIAFAKAAAIDANSTTAWSSLAQCCFVQKKYAQALAAYEQAFERGVSTVTTYYNAGCCARNLAKPDQCVDYLSRALQLNPKHKLAHLELALLYEKIPDQARALAHFRQAHALDPTDRQVCFRYGRFLGRQGDHTAAVALLDASAEDKSSAPSAMLKEIANAYMAQGKVDAAIATIALRDDANATTHRYIPMKRVQQSNWRSLPGFSELAAMPSFVIDTSCITPQLMRAKNVTFYGHDWLTATTDNHLLVDGIFQLEATMLDKSEWIACRGAGRVVMRQPTQVTHIDDPVFFLNYATSYYHWLLDCLPRLLWLESQPTLRQLPIVTGPALSASAREMLDLLGLQQARLIPLRYDEALQAAEAFFSSSFSQDMFLHPAAIDWLVNRLGTKQSTQHKRRLLISRNDAGGRRLDNEAEVFELLEKHGFERVLASALSVRQQIDLFSQAEIIVGPHGAGLVNALFAPEGAIVIDIQNVRQTVPFFQTLTRQRKQSFVAVAGDPIPDESRRRHDWDMRTDARELEKRVLTLLAGKAR